MTFIDLSVLGCYFLMILVIGFLFNRSGNNSQNFFAGGGNVPWWISGLSLYMSFFSAGVFVVWGSIAYQQGLVAIAIQWTMCIAGLIVAIWIAPRWKRTNILTAAEYIGKRFGTPLQQIYVYLFMFLGVIIAGAVLYPVARMLEVATGFSLFWSISILGGIIVLYTTIGGFWAVLVTDVLQFVILMATVILMVPLSLQKVGGFTEFLSRLPESHLSLTSSEYTPIFMVSFILVHIFKIGGDWTFIQRFTSVKDEKAASSTGFLFTALYLFSPVFWMIPPIAYFLINPSLDRQASEAAYIQMCQLVLPVGMLGMMLAAMISATASSANTILNMCAAVFTNDVYKKLIRPDSTERNLMLVARTSTVIFGILTVMIANGVPYMGGVVALVFSINALTYVPLLAPPVWALFSNRINRKGMYLSIGGGLLVNIFFKFIYPNWYGYTLNRTEETVVGLIVTPLILIGLELFGKSSETNFELPNSKNISPISNLTEYRHLQLDPSFYGVKIVAWTFISTGLGFLIIGLITSANNIFVASIGIFITIFGISVLKINKSNINKFKLIQSMEKTNQQSLSELTSSELSFYHKNGYIILRNRFSDTEVKSWQEEASKLLNSDFINENNLRTPMHKMSDGNQVVERIDPVIDVSDLFKSLLNDLRILNPLRQIFEEEPVLFKDKLIFKVPGMRGYEMHQDFAWWQPQPGEKTFEAIHPDRILSVMLAIDSANRENGALELYPGYHLSLLTPEGELRNMKEQEISQIDMNGKVLAETLPGDIIIFHALTPHSSEPNRSNTSRRQLYMTYNAQSCGDAYKGQQVHYRGYVKKRLEGENQIQHIYFQ